MTVDELIGYSNALVVFFSLVVGLLFVRQTRYYLRTGQTGLICQLSAGIALVALGTFINRGYYGIWRWSRLTGNSFPLDDYHSVPVIAIGMVVVGYAYHIRASGFPRLGFVAFGAACAIFAMAVLW